MAFTHSKLAEVTVGSGGASAITFNNIPQNYTDLVVKGSLRSSLSANNGDQLSIQFNGSTTSYSYRLLQGNGASANSYNNTTRYFGDAPASLATANTFGNLEIYIPSYTSANNKSYSADSVTENNATTALANIDAGLWSNATAINQITLTNSASNFVQHSTAYLYGIRIEL